LNTISLLASYLRDLKEEDLRAAAVFFTGRPFPLTDARTLNVGWSALVSAVQQSSGASDATIHQIYLDRGDLGELAERLLGSPSRPGRGPGEAGGESLSSASVQAKLADLVRLSGASNKM